MRIKEKSQEKFVAVSGLLKLFINMNEIFHISDAPSS